MKQNEENINYYSIIPATVLYNKDLKANEKLLYAIITSLSNKEGYCFATNKYFAEKQRKIYINDVPYPLNNGYMYQSKNGQAIHKKVEDNIIRNNIKFNKKVHSNYTNQREYSEEFLNSLYANSKYIN